MKLFKILQASIDFATNFLIFSQGWGGGGRRRRNPYKSTFQIFLNFALNFREDFEKILKFFSKNLEISLKIYKFFIDFY